MLDFITIPLVVGTVTVGVYKLFELFARRKERLLMIEKMSENIDFSNFKSTFPSFTEPIKMQSLSSIKIGCLLMGLGLGLLVGFIILLSVNNDQYYEIRSIIYGASVLLFGGISLVASFFIEQHIQVRERNK